MTATAKRVTTSQSTTGLPGREEARHSASLSAISEPTNASLAVATAEVATAEFWAAELARESIQTSCTTIGLISGSRYASSRCVIDGYARRIAAAITELRAKRPMLIVRLDVRTDDAPPRSGPSAEAPPATSVSPLGPWSEVTVPVPVGKRAGWWLEHLPHWLPTWKREFGFLLIDLGPIAEVPSRVIGRLCDGCYVLLGPEACGSHEWLLQHVAWHDRSGCTICGTLLTELE